MHILDSLIPPDRIMDTLEAHRFKRIIHIWQRNPASGEGICDDVLIWEDVLVAVSVHVFVDKGVVCCGRAEDEKAGVEDAERADGAAGGLCEIWGRVEGCEAAVGRDPGVWVVWAVEGVAGAGVAGCEDACRQ